MAFVLTQAQEILAATPETLAAWLPQLSTNWTEADEGPETWNVRQILGHLIHGEDTDWIPRARMILNERRETFAPFDRFAQETRFVGVSLPELVTTFRVKRSANLTTLRGWQLTVQQLALQGIHPALGPVTLQQLLATWVVHDLAHVAQMARVMAKRYSSEVGPWSEYLTVLSR